MYISDINPVKMSKNHNNVYLEAFYSTASKNSLIMRRWVHDLSPEFLWFTEYQINWD